MDTRYPEIQAVLTAYHDAVVAKDIEKMLSLYSYNVRIFDTWEHWEADGKQWREMIVKWFGHTGNGHDNPQFKDTQIVMQGEMAVVSTYVVYIGENAANERQESIKNRLTLALIREAGVWKIFQEHSSVPLQMEDFKGIFEPD